MYIVLSPLKVDHQVFVAVIASAAVLHSRITLYSYYVVYLFLSIDYLSHYITSWWFSLLLVKVNASLVKIIFLSCCLYCFSFISYNIIVLLLFWMLLILLWTFQKLISDYHCYPYHFIIVLSLFWGNVESTHSLSLPHVYFRI